MSTTLNLKTEQIDAHFNTDDGILRVKYSGVLSPEVTTTYYSWLFKMMGENPELVSLARASIYDFTDVTEFVSSNISTSSRQSNSLAEREDVVNHPVHPLDVVEGRPTGIFSGGSQDLSSIHRGGEVVF